MKMTIEQLMSIGLIEKRIAGFPYPVKFCVYCNKEMLLVKTLHIQESPENFKAIYVCYNTRCEAYDEPAGRAYVKVYYSTERAASMLDNITLHFHAPWKE